MDEGTVSISLSADAAQALQWLFSDHARNLSCGEARAAILEGFGPKVDAELQEYFERRER